jgi:hypothetical protein
VTSPKTIIFIFPFASNRFSWFEKKYKTPPFLCLSIRVPIYQLLYRFVYRCICTWLSCLSSVFVCLFIYLYPSYFSLFYFSCYFSICIFMFPLSFLSFILQRQHASSHRPWWGPTLWFHQRMSSTCTTLIFILYLWFEDLMVVTMNITVFWNVMPRSLVDILQRFGCLCCFHLQCRIFSTSHPLITGGHAGGSLCITS